MNYLPSRKVFEHASWGGLGTAMYSMVFRMSPLLSAVMACVVTVFLIELGQYLFRDRTPDGGLDLKLLDRIGDIRDFQGAGWALYAGHVHGPLWFFLVLAAWYLLWLGTQNVLK